MKVCSFVFSFSKQLSGISIKQPRPQMKATVHVQSQVTVGDLDTRRVNILWFAFPVDQTVVAI